MFVDGLSSRTTSYGVLPTRDTGGRRMWRLRVCFTCKFTNSASAGRAVGRDPPCSKPQLRSTPTKIVCYLFLVLFIFGIFILGTGKRGHYESGLFTGGISRISKLSRISRNGGILLYFLESGGSLKSLESLNSLEYLKIDFCLFPKDPFFRTRFSFSLDHCK